MTDSLRFEKGIYIFNPDTDFALASGSKFYTPPASVIALRRKMGALPALYAPEGSAILLFDKDDIPAASTDARLRHAIATKKITLLAPEDLPEYLDRNRDTRFFPWGWNHALRHFLLQNGASAISLPSETDLDHVRRLSHRRLTIDANRFFIESGIAKPDALPHEFTCAEAAQSFLNENHGAWFKAPWSSSGRGVINSSELWPEETMQWVRGTIRRQGSVMAETAADKQCDFASEWIITPDHNPLFAGLSMFETSNRGKYKRNVSLAQEDIISRFRENTLVDPASVIEYQRLFLQKEVAPFYAGPVGIDMMTDKAEGLRPCVEINLRMTMGIVALFDSPNITS